MSAAVAGTTFPFRPNRLLRQPSRDVTRASLRAWQQARLRSRSGRRARSLIPPGKSCDNPCSRQGDGTRQRRRTPAARPEQERGGPGIEALASGRKRAQGRDAASPRVPSMLVGPAPCFWRFAGRVCLWSRDLHRLGCGTRIGLPRHFPHRFDAGGCGVSARRPLRHVCGGELLRLDPGGFDDPGSAFALAQHEPREVGLRHAHRFATVFHERGAHAGI